MSAKVKPITLMFVIIVTTHVTVLTSVTIVTTHSTLLSIIIMSVGTV
jgi:hypothetical protein